jgi:hypothetical protein
VITGLLQVVLLEIRLGHLTEALEEDRGGLCESGLGHFSGSYEAGQRYAVIKNTHSERRPAIQDRSRPETMTKASDPPATDDFSTATRAVSPVRIHPCELRAMAEPLKEMFNRSYFERLSKEVSISAPRVDGGRLLKDLMNGNAGRELNARMRHASITLGTHLPSDYRKAVDVLKDVAPRMPKGYTALLYPDFVGQYGQDDPVVLTRSVEVLHLVRFLGVRRARILPP